MMEECRQVLALLEERKVKKLFLWTEKRILAGYGKKL